jgi:porin
VASSVLGIAACNLAAAQASSSGDGGTWSSVNPSVVYDGAAVTNARGGAHTGSNYISNLNVQLDIDLARLVGWPDAIAYLDGLWVQGGSPSSLVGDAQGVSSISAPNSLKLYEGWIQKNFSGNRVSVLAGLYDLNSEFYRLQSTDLFLNSSFGIGPEFSQSGVEGPSIFPDTALGMRIALKPVEAIVIRTAVLDGVPLDRPNGSRGAFESGDGLLIVTEADFLDRPAPQGRPPSRRFRIGRQAMLGAYDTKLAIGGWYYTATFDDLSETQPDGQPVRHHGSNGFYALVDRLLWNNPDRPEQRLSGFLQAGIGDNRVNRFGSYFGAGLTVTGPFPGRSADELGLGLADARNGSHYISAQTEQGLPVRKAEKSIELTYLIQLNTWLALQPDVQYVISPNTTPAIANALVLQLRLEIMF